MRSTWKSIMEEGADKLLTDCKGAICRLHRLQQLTSVLAEARKQTLRSALQHINTQVNRAIVHRPDGMRQEFDRWATFVETVTYGYGDCEDVAIVKMWMLRALGIPSASLRLVIIRAGELPKDHAVLVVEAGPETLVLDNLSDRVLADRVLPSYRPVLSFGDHIWAHAVRPAQARVASAR